ncbi:MAG: DUF5698 domain-containing protein [Fibromonadaceae bacterium]|jgi:uncharacterized protein YebE (UPF0316 family)|nr:DUF5698 domain-containing protein [Fibromonadaceae bacterium]
MTELFSQIPLWALHWIIFPMLIIMARMCDVSLGTLRIILVGKGHKNVAPFIGFVEVLIWIFVVSQIIQNLDKIQYYVAFALGHACGTFLGIKIENKLSLGQVIVRVITNHNFEELTNSLKERNLNFTTMDAAGKFGPVKVILIITQRHLLKETIKIIEAKDQNFFYSIEDVKYVKGTLPGGKNPILSSLNPFKPFKKV